MASRAILFGKPQIIQPSANRKYKMTYSGGEIESTTDEDGLTAIVKSETPETVKLDVF